MNASVIVLDVNVLDVNEPRHAVESLGPAFERARRGAGAEIGEGDAEAPPG